MLANLSFRLKLVCLVAVAIVGMLVVAGISAVQYRGALAQAADVKTEALVRAAVTAIDGLVAEEKAGRLKRDEAQARAKALLRPMRYGPADYFFIIHTDATYVLSPMAPDAEGKDIRVIAKDDQTRGLYQLFADTVRAGGEGPVHYRFRRGQEENLPKAGFIKTVPDWGWMVGTAIYVDDIDAAFRAYLLQFVGLVLLVGGAVVAIALLVGRSVTRPLARIEATMGELAAGKLAIEIPGTERCDEIGRMASA
ncbi:MAG: cache domain-containing protein, partial [Alphaproteobacteria bacterium]|nr:cache domain-containing protein [Alphaproteobacteria bacterium]